MSEELVLVRTEDGISTVTINRPQKLNAINTELAVALHEALDRLRDETRVVVLSAAGERAFVGGADVREMQRLDSVGARQFIQILHEMCWAALSHPQPVIAALHGHCLGAGLELAVSCDFRIAADNTKFGMPEIKLGIPSVIEAALMPQLVGAAWTSELLFTGDTIDANRAAQIGLVSRVVPREQLMGEAMALARQLASYSPLVLRQQKSLVRAWRGNDLEASIRLGIDAFAESFQTGHPSEGLTAFLDGRQAKYE